MNRTMATRDYTGFLIRFNMVVSKQNRRLSFSGKNITFPVCGSSRVIIPAATYLWNNLLQMQKQLYAKYQWFAHSPATSYRQLAAKK